MQSPSFRALSISKQPVAVWEWEALKAGRFSLWNYPGAHLKFPAGPGGPLSCHTALGSTWSSGSPSAATDIQQHLRSAGGAVSSSWPARSLCSPAPARTAPWLSWAAGKCPMFAADQAESERRTGASHAAELYLEKLQSSSCPLQQHLCVLFKQETTTQIRPWGTRRLQPLEAAGPHLPKCHCLGVFLYRRSIVKPWDGLGWKGP